MLIHYINQGVDGIIPLGTTGESPTILDYEYEAIMNKTMEVVNKKTKVYVGLGSNNTAKILKDLKIVEKYKVDGILSVVPYYSRPSQRGIYQHFKSISDSSYLDIIIYNIPYRTGVKVENETIYKLAELKNVIGLKDCSADIVQTTDLLLNPPKDFSILTGEDAHFYTTLVLGAHGGILASANLETKKFIEVYNLIKNNNHELALEKWKKLYNFIPLLFSEPNPSPLKYCLKNMGLIESDEVRLPLLNISDDLKNKLYKILL